jgi:hypothetical protein
MPTTPQTPPAVDPFAPVHELVADVLRSMSDLTAARTHDVLEQELLISSREFARRAIQGHLDALAAKERRDLTPPAVMAPEATRRSLRRSLLTVFGKVTVTRMGWRDHRVLTYFPTDTALNLPAEQYSFTVRRFMAEHVAEQSFETSQRFLDQQGIEVPKRQAEELVVRMAQDFGVFYRWHQACANDGSADDCALVMSCDATGIRMIPTALRDATRKEAAEAHDRPRGDPMASRKDRTYDHRMAVVTAVWDQPLKVRTAEQILDNLRPAAERRLDREDSRLPAPRNKVVSATISDNQATAIQWMFDEAERRDPEHRREWVVLIDGARSQWDQIEAEAARRGVRVRIVMDLLHVMSYVWKAANALHGTGTRKAEDWACKYVGRLLTGSIVDAVAGMRQSATLRKATASAREVVETCAAYLLDRLWNLDYKSALAKGWPIASGVIEGACRHLVKDRMGITGARWDLPMAEAVLRLRALQVSDHWAAYLRFHLERESFRNHRDPKVAKNAA